MDAVGRTFDSPSAPVKIVKIDLRLPANKEKMTIEEKDEDVHMIDLDNPLFLFQEYEAPQPPPEIIPTVDVRTLLTNNQNGNTLSAAFFPLSSSRK